MRKFGAKDQIGYIFGDAGGSFVNLYIESFFLVFATYVLGVNPVFMGSLFLFARLWDAINDPIIGSFPDRWYIGKSGDKFKPYIRIAMIPLALSGVLCFTDVSGFADTFKYIWVAGMYVFYGMAYTGASMPYGAMASVITNDPIERTKLSRARSVGGAVVGFVALSLVPIFIWDSANNIVPKAFFIIAIVFGVLSIISYLLLLRMTIERERHPKPDKKFDYKKVIVSALKNRPLIGVMVATVGSLLYITGYMQLTSYAFKEFYGAPQLVSIVQISMLPLLIISFIIIPRLSKRFGKQKLILFGIAYNLVFALFLFLVPIKNVYVYLAMSIIGNSGQMPFMMLIWALVTDCIDYHEYSTGERNDGSLYSIYTFARKLGSTLASSIAGFGLALVGYVSGIPSQTPQVASNIRYVYTAIPVITSILILIGVGLIYNLSNEKLQEIRNKLKLTRRESETEQ